MKLTCAKCRGELVPVNEDTYVCQTEAGHRYQVLYLNPNAPALAPDPAADDGTSGLRVPPPPASEAAGLPSPQATTPIADLAVKRERCCNHPQKVAETGCSLCSSPLCETCAFVHPQGYRICPECVCAEPRKSMSRNRLITVICSGVLGVASLAGFGGAGLLIAAGTEELEGITGLLILGAWVLLIGGYTCGAGAISKRYGTPWYVWGAFGFNLIILLILVLAMSLGLFGGGLA